MVNLKAILDKAPEGATHYTDGTPSLNVYVKVVHLDGCYLHLGGKWERYPFYAGLKCLDDLRGMLELQAERDALEAQVEALKSAVIAVRDVPRRSGFQVNDPNPKAERLAWMRLNEALTVTPQQHLAEIRAEAGRAGFIAGCEYAGDGVCSIPDAKAADQYAERIRSGEME